MLFGALVSVLVLLFTAGPAGATSRNGHPVRGHAGARSAQHASARPTAQRVKRPPAVSAAHPAGQPKAVKQRVAAKRADRHQAAGKARADRKQSTEVQGHATNPPGQRTGNAEAAGAQGLGAATPSLTQREIQQAAQAAAQLAAQAAAELAAQLAAEQAAQQVGRQGQAGPPSTVQPANQPAGGQQSGNQPSGDQPVSVRPVGQTSSRVPGTSARSSGQAQHGSANRHPAATRSLPESLPRRVISTPVVPIIALATASLSVGSGPALIVLLVMAGAGLLLVAAGTRRSALPR